MKEARQQPRCTASTVQQRLRCKNTVNRDGKNTQTEIDTKPLHNGDGQRHEIVTKPLLNGDGQRHEIATKLLLNGDGQRHEIVTKPLLNGDGQHFKNTAWWQTWRHGSTAVFGASIAPN